MTPVRATKDIQWGQLDDISQCSVIVSKIQAGCELNIKLLFNFHTKKLIMEISTFQDQL